ncbi:hypothetical protein F5Y16DRAFT_423849 [Xylariaceae sp. FL0255]|nr:hypothetical protein F5Y16DRAFT_423849 [Xylariaceae sp. FL0255]
MYRFLLILIAFVTGANSALHELLVGTFSTKFIYTVEFDDEASTLRLVGNQSVPYAANWLAFSHNKANLYTTAYGQSNEAQNPMFLSYSIANATSIEHQATLDAGGGCSATSIFISGTLESVVQNYTYFPNVSGVHGAVLSPDSRFLYSADDSGNTLWTHSVDRRTGEVTYMANLTGPSAGSDPRHVTIYPNGRYLYVILEGTSQLAQYTVDAHGIPHFDTAYPLLLTALSPAAYWADEVALSASKKYLWATNRARAANSTGFVSVFSLSDEGAIVKQNFLIPSSSSGGISNILTPNPSIDRWAALTSNSTGFLEIWELKEDGTSASVAAHLDINDGGGCCSNALWYS